MDSHSPDASHPAHLSVQALLELDEPYRSTLLLRYFEELKPAEIPRKLSRRGAAVPLPARAGRRWRERAG